MSTKSELLLIDAGNTSVKVALCDGREIISVNRFSPEDLHELGAYLSANKHVNGAMTSVLSADKTNEILVLHPSLLLINSTSRLPMQNAYATPETLGIDRLCNACGVFGQLETNYGVSIDIGTCIKFDLVSKKEGYLGGSISPGIQLRYKALNDYTGKLPLLSNKVVTDFVGTDTPSSIHAGVYLGALEEIEGMMNRYRNAYEGLTFFVTGGDAKYFDLHSKNDIFADDNLTLHGLLEIYKQNA